MYSCSHLEIDSIVVNSIFLLITEEKKIACKKYKEQFGQADLRAQHFYSQSI